LGRFDEAVSAHQEAAAIFREVGDRHHEGVVLRNLGLSLREVGRFDEAVSAFQAAAAILRETGGRHLEHMALENLELARTAARSEKTDGPIS
jgi:tetratricopeptide (TPR) repeat protein